MVYCGYVYYGYVYKSNLQCLLSVVFALKVSQEVLPLLINRLATRSILDISKLDDNKSWVFRRKNSIALAYAPHRPMLKVPF